MSKKSTKINFNKSNMQAIGKICLAQEGIISKSDFQKYSTSNMMNKYISEGYFKKSNDDYIQATEKFANSFRKDYGKINPDYCSSYFSGSKSINHTSGIERIVQSIDRNAIIKDNVYFKSGKDLSDEFNSVSKYKAYKEEVNNYVSEKLEEITNYKQELQELYSNDNKSVDDYLYQRELEDKLSHSEMIIDIYNNRGIQNFCSPPDLQITTDIETFKNQIDNLKSDLDNEDLTRKEFNSLSSTIDQMEQVLEQTITRNETVITYAVESVTDNYRNIDLCLKENYEVITHTDIIYVRV